jgi:hypothetical protein
VIGAVRCQSFYKGRPMFLDYASDAVERLTHVRDHVENDPLLGKLIANVNADVPHKKACLLMLSGHALGKAMVAWFANHNLIEFKDWLYTAAEIDRLSYQTQIDTSAPGAKFLQLLKPLVSDNASLINWFSQYDLTYDVNRIEDPGTEDFLAYQAILAIRGDWTLLTDRCGRVAANLLPGRVQKKYSIDYQFYAALALHDVPGMRNAINQLLTPKLLLKREDFEDGFTVGFISSYAVIYTKLAFMHGINLDLNSKYIPSEWLQIAPNDQYTFQFPTLNRFAVS